MSCFDSLTDMTTPHEQPRANKARLDNRWGCSVGHAVRNFDPLPVSTLTAAPERPPNE